MSSIRAKAPPPPVFRANGPVLRVSCDTTRARAPRFIFGYCAVASSHANDHSSEQLTICDSFGGSNEQFLISLAKGYGSSHCALVQQISAMVPNVLAAAAVSAPTRRARPKALRSVPIPAQNATGKIELQDVLLAVKREAEVARQLASDRSALAVQRSLRRSSGNASPSAATAAGELSATRSAGSADAGGSHDASDPAQHKQRRRRIPVTERLAVALRTSIASIHHHVTNCAALEHARTGGASLVIIAVRGKDLEIANVGGFRAVIGCEMDASGALQMTNHAGARAQRDDDDGRGDGVTAASAAVGSVHTNLPSAITAHTAVATAVRGGADAQGALIAHVLTGSSLRSDDADTPACSFQTGLDRTACTTSATPAHAQLIVTARGARGGDSTHHMDDVHGATASRAGTRRIQSALERLSTLQSTVAIVAVSDECTGAPTSIGQLLSGPQQPLSGEETRNRHNGTLPSSGDTVPTFSFPHFPALPSSIEGALFHADSTYVSPLSKQAAIRAHAAHESSAVTSRAIAAIASRTSAQADRLRSSMLATTPNSEGNSPSLDRLRSATLGVALATTPSDCYSPHNFLSLDSTGSNSGDNDYTQHEVIIESRASGITGRYDPNQHVRLIESSESYSAAAGDAEAVDFTLPPEAWRDYNAAAGLSVSVSRNIAAAAAAVTDATGTLVLIGDGDTVRNQHSSSAVAKSAELLQNEIANAELAVGIIRDTTAAYGDTITDANNTLGTGNLSPTSQHYTPPAARGDLHPVDRRGFPLRVTLPITLTLDHRPDRPDENARLLATGAKVLSLPGLLPGDRHIVPRITRPSNSSSAHIVARITSSPSSGSNNSNKINGSSSRSFPRITSSPSSGSISSSSTTNRSENVSHHCLLPVSRCIGFTDAHALGVTAEPQITLHRINASPPGGTQTAAVVMRNGGGTSTDAAHIVSGANASSSTSTLAGSSNSCASNALGRKDKFLVVASEAVWEVCSSEEAVSIVSHALSSALNGGSASTTSTSLAVTPVSRTTTSCGAVASALTKSNNGARAGCTDASTVAENCRRACLASSFSRDEQALISSTLASDPLSECMKPVLPPRIHMRSSALPATTSSITTTTRASTTQQTRPGMRALASVSAATTAGPLPLSSHGGGSRIDVRASAVAPWCSGSGGGNDGADAHDLEESLMPAATRLARLQRQRALAEYAAQSLIAFASNRWTCAAPDHGTTSSSGTANVRRPPVDLSALVLLFD